MTPPSPRLTSPARMPSICSPPALMESRRRIGASGPPTPCAAEIADGLALAMTDIDRMVDDNDEAPVHGWPPRSSQGLLLGGWAPHGAGVQSDSGVSSWNLPPARSRRTK